MSGNIYHITDHLCGESRCLPMNYQHKRPVMQSFGVSSYVRTSSWVALKSDALTLILHHRNGLNVSSVCLKLIQFSQLSSLLYGAVRIQLTHFSYDDCENTCTLSYYHRQIGSMTHLPLFRVRSWKNGMFCMSFYILLSSFTVVVCWNYTLWLLRNQRGFSSMLCWSGLTKLIYYGHLISSVIA